MFRKITLITMAVVLGLAVFAGCSNDAITSSDSDTGNLVPPGIRGTVTHNGEPYEGAEIKFTGGVGDVYKYTDEIGYYRWNCPDGSYTIKCTIGNGFWSESDTKYATINEENPSAVVNFDF